MLCILGRPGFEGRADSGAWVMKVAEEESSIILEDSCYNAGDKSHAGIRVLRGNAFTSKHGKWDQ